MSLKTFLKLCVLFNVSPNDLLGWQNIFPEPEPMEEPAPYLYFNNFHPMIGNLKRRTRLGENYTLWEDLEQK